MTPKEIGIRIRQFRKRAKISQLELELRIDAAFGSISRIENGITNPTKETLFAIAEALELSTYETAFLFGIELESPSQDRSITDRQFDNIYPI